MKEQDTKKRLTPLEHQIASEFNITPEELFISAKLGVKPEDLLEQKGTKWTERSKKISEGK